MNLLQTRILEYCQKFSMLPLSILQHTVIPKILSYKNNSKLATLATEIEILNSPIFDKYKTTKVKEDDENLVLQYHTK